MTFSRKNNRSRRFLKVFVVPIVIVFSASVSYFAIPHKSEAQQATACLGPTNNILMEWFSYLTVGGPSLARSSAASPPDEASIYLFATETADQISNIREHAQTINDAFNAMVTRMAEEEGKFIDGVIKALYDLERKRYNTSIAYDYQPNPLACQTTLGRQAMLVTEKRAEKMTIEQERTNAMMLNNSSGSYTDNGTGAAMANYSVKRRTTYCNPMTYDDTTGSACSNNPSTPQEEELINADRRPYSFILNNERIDNFEEDVPHDIAMLLVSPAAPPEFDDQELNSSAGFVMERQRHASLARLSMAMGAIQSLIQMRVPSADLGDWVSNIRASAFQGVGGSISSEISDLEGEEVSLYQIMKVLFSERTKDATYLARLQQMPEKNVTQEYVSLMSQQLMLQWEEYKHMQLLESMLSVRLALEIERTRVDNAANVGRVK